MGKYIRKIMVALLYVATFGISVAIFVSNYLCKFMLGSRKHLRKAKEKDLLTRKQEQNRLFMSANGIDAYITSWDGLELHALEIPAKEESHKYVIICHGYKSNALNMGGDAIRFREAGYHILAPDARGLGESEGNYIGMGWPERRDVVDWARRIIQEDGQARILLFGLSMGAATVMMAAGEEDLPNQVKAVVEDCGYTSVWEEFQVQIRKMCHLPALILRRPAPLRRWQDQRSRSCSFTEARICLFPMRCTGVYLRLQGARRKGLSLAAPPMGRPVLSTKTDIGSA